MATGQYILFVLPGSLGDLPGSSQKVSGNYHFHSSVGCYECSPGLVKRDKAISA